MKRILVLCAVLTLLAAPVVAQAPAPPAGAVVIVVGLSDGLTVLPVSSGVLPLVCSPVAP
jgi:hypothetical protein